MIITIWAVVATAATLLGQVVVWRAFKPVHQYSGLLALFGAVLISAPLVFQLLSSIVPVSLLPPFTPMGYATFGFLYLVLGLSYMVTFSAVQGESPSMLIMLRVRAAGVRGISRTELEHALGDCDYVLVLARLDDLVTGGLATRHDERYFIAPKGSLLASMHVLYRALLGMEKGG